MKQEVKELLYNRFPYAIVNVEENIDRGIIYLNGCCEDWETLVEIGHIAGSLPDIKSVVNDIEVTGLRILKPDYSDMEHSGRAIGIIASTDVVIVGAGVTGSGIARELSKYDMKVIVVEKGEDVATGATKANNGDIHSGYLEKPGTLKARLNVKGNAMYSDWARELNFGFKRPGNLMVISDLKFMGELEYAKSRADANGVVCRFVDEKEICELEPLAAKSEKPFIAGVFVPSMGTVDPWEVAIALSENAVVNGVTYYLDCGVAAVDHAGSRIEAVVTNKGIIKTKYVINCAGVYADDISAMAGDHCFTIHPRKGVIAILDKNAPSYNRPFRIIDDDRPLRSTKSSKGGGMATTIAGNNLLGPSADEIWDKEDLTADTQGLKFAMARNSISQIGYPDIIRFFTGVRPATYTEDFFIEESPVTSGLINVAGIQSPGLAASPAIAELVINILLNSLRKAGLYPKQKNDFNPIRKPKVKFSELTREEQNSLIKKLPEYGRIICRCESITEGEILAAIRSPIVPVSIDAVKRRTRAGMGRCQGGFCQARVLEILARELGKPWTDITLKGSESNILTVENRTEGVER